MENVGITGSNGHMGNNLYNKLVSEHVFTQRLTRQATIPDGITRLYDFASYGNKYGQNDTKEIIRANVDRVVSLLNSCLDKGLKSIVLTSTSSVLLPTLTPYAESKNKMEELATNFAKNTGENIVIVRPSTVTGLGEDPNRLIPKLIHSALTGAVMDFVGEPTHDYIDVDDFNDAVLFLSYIAKEERGHIFNVSSGVSVSNEFIKDIVTKVVGRKPNLNRVDSLRSYDTKNWNVPNNKLLALGWRPKKTVIDSIIEMVEKEKKTWEIE